MEVGAVILGRKGSGAEVELKGCGPLSRFKEREKMFDVNRGGRITSRKWVTWNKPSQYFISNYAPNRILCAIQYIFLVKLAVRTLSQGEFKNAPFAVTLPT